MGWGPVDIGRRRTRQRALIVIGSGLAHLLTLFVLVAVTPRQAFQLPADPPPIKLQLIAPTLRPSPRPLIQPTAARPAAATMPVHVAPPTAQPALPVAPGSAAAAPATADNGSIHFYENNTPNCAREDLVLMSPAERIRCAPKKQTADGTGGRAIPRDGPTLDGIDARKRAGYDAVVAEREARWAGNEGAQAGLRNLQATEIGKSRKFDINGGFNCKLAFGVNAKPGLGGLKCTPSPPDLPPPKTP